MLTHMIEVTQTSNFNWGKFLVAEFDIEWDRRAEMDGAEGSPLLAGRGWDRRRHIFVLDLQTGEGAILPRVTHWDREGTHQLSNKHQIWVCPMMEPFLNWFLLQDFKKVTDLPTKVTLDTPIEDMYGQRGNGPYKTAVAALKEILSLDPDEAHSVATEALIELREIEPAGTPVPA